MQYSLSSDIAADGGALTDRDPTLTLLALRVEVLNVCTGYPLAPSAVLNRAAAQVAHSRGWIARQLDGRYVPTDEGLRWCHYWVDQGWV